VSRPSVQRLLGACRPSAIHGFVVAHIVDAVDGVLGTRLGANVGVKRLKRVQPALADGNASSAVSVKVSPCDSGAAVDHIGPTRVFAAVCHAVCSRPLDQLFTPETSTGVGPRQVGGLHSHESPAFAAELVFGPALLSAVTFGDDSKPSVLKTNGVSGHASTLPYFGPLLAFGVN
jgi:hypothetical protein